MASTKVQLDSSGRRKINTAGKTVIADTGDPCCCTAGCDAVPASCTATLSGFTANCGTIWNGAFVLTNGVYGPDGNGVTLCLSCTSGVWELATCGLAQFPFACDAGAGAFFSGIWQLTAASPLGAYTTQVPNCGAAPTDSACHAEFLLSTCVLS